MDDDEENFCDVWIGHDYEKKILERHHLYAEDLEKKDVFMVTRFSYIVEDKDAWIQFLRDEGLVLDGHSDVVPEPNQLS